MQNVSAHAATIFWTLPTRKAAQVRVTGPDGFIQVFDAEVTEFHPGKTALDRTYFQYRANVNGLARGTRHAYEVIADGTPLPAPVNRPLEFRTEGPGPFRFVHFADAGEGSAEQFALSRQMHGEAAHFALANGDLAYDLATHASIEANYYDVYREMMAQVPFFATLGNHEYYTDGANPSLSGREHPIDGVPHEDHGRYYSFDWGNAHFIALDTNWPLEKAAQGEGEMLRWLEQDLRSTRKFWRIAFFHHPGFATGKHEASVEATRVREHIAPILEAHGVQLVLNGHEHTYQRTHPLKGGAVVDPDSGGCVYVTSGGGGAQAHYFSPNERIAKSLGVNHYLHTQVNGSELQLRACGLGGSDIDALTLRPKPSISAVVNAASFTADVAAGGAISIFGRNLFSETAGGGATEAFGCSVLLDGEPLPILFGDALQINVQLPVGKVGQGVLVVRTPNGSVETTIHVRAVAPALFANPGEPGVALAVSNGTLVNSVAPVEAGRAVSLFATGLRAETAVRARFGSAEVPASIAATSYAGIWRVDARVPEAAAREAVPVQIASGETASNVLAIPVQ